MAEQLFLGLQHGHFHTFGIGRSGWLICWRYIGNSKLTLAHSVVANHLSSAMFTRRAVC